MKRIEDRFWAKVQKTDSCWNWTGARKQGYGAIQAGRRGSGQKIASRASWEINIGPIPDKLQVLHRCDNRACVNPDHLFLGTQEDNIHDAMKKGRFIPPPPNFGIGKLNEIQVREIKHKLRTGLTHKKIASEYSVAISTVSMISSGKNWSWVQA